MSMNSGSPPTLPAATAGDGEPGSGSPPHPSSPGTRIGQYELIRPLGQGGMGVVHLARDLRLGRLVAVKLLTTPWPDLDERVLAEARATARCRHENIVVIYDVGAHGRRPYMVLEYLEGQTLRQWMTEHAATASPARVPPGRAVDLMIPVVRALVYAHDQGIVHRDLKPENVILTRTGVIKVLDFGVAKHMEAPVIDPDGETGPAASRSARVGTRPYMAPEQLGPAAVDHRADVWAAGIMLFELATGAHPVLDAPAPLAAQAAITDEHTAMPAASERVPGLGPLAGIIDRCLLKNRAHRTPSARVLLAELEALAANREPAPASHDGSPFAGLAAFQESDADRFFGRDRDIDHLVAELRSRPLVALVGPSGAGKSSLIRAGVLPSLKRSGEAWDTHIVRPGRDALTALAGVLAQLDSVPGDAAGASSGDVAAPEALGLLRAEPGLLGARLRAYATSKRRRIAVFVDQLEELYTLGAPPAERAAFLACIAAIADDAASPLRVLITMRSDFLDRLAEDRRVAAEIARGLVLLSPMDRTAMREALVRPVEASAHRFEAPALVDRMVDAVAATPGALPLLQFTAARLWEARDRERRLLTAASYEQLGGVSGALAAHADSVLAGMSASQQALARAVLERLVTPERTRAPVSVAELHALRGDPAPVDEIIQHLAAMRLVVAERGGADGDATVELVHESLIDRWPTLVRWLDGNQDDAVMLARLRVAARDWERGDHATGLLWTGEIARDARVWQARYRGELAPVEQRYLAAVRAAADRTRRLRRRLFGAILAAAALAATAMAWLAWNQTEARRAAAGEAMRARDATRMAAMRALAGDPTTQLAVLREIEDVHAPPPDAAQEARRLLHAGVAAVIWSNRARITSARYSPDGRRIVVACDDKLVRVWNVDGSGVPVALRGHSGDVGAAAFSPDGRRIVSASADRTVRLWNADGSGVPVVLRGHDDEVVSAVFSPDGRRIASASMDRTVRIWSVDGSGAPVVLRGHGDAVTSAQFSPDGRRIASASMDRTVRIWSVDGSGAPMILRGHGDAVSSAVFSPDGRRIASASVDKTVRIWNADGDGEPLVLRGHDDVVNEVTFSPDGGRIASASNDKTVRIWNTDGSGEPLVLSRHDEVVKSVAFSPDGRRVASGSWDKTVRIWNVDRPREPRVLRGHDDVVYSAAFSRDGRRIVSASQDGTIRVRNADGSRDPLILRGHDGPVFSAMFSPDGQRIASGSLDRTVQLWNADGSGAPRVLRGHDGPVTWVTFSRDGRSLASASFDRTVRVWDAQGGGEPAVLRGHDDTVSSVAFSPDGQHLVSSSFDWTVRVWNTTGRGAPLVLRGHAAAVGSAAFSPDGKRVVSASSDRTVRIWNIDVRGEHIDLRGEPVILRGHEDLVTSVEFSPDGRHIVSTSADKTIRIWNADGTGAPVVLVGHESLITQAHFSPEGERIVSASWDRTVRVWHDLSPATLDDPRLWTATDYCVSIERRIKLLGDAEDQARRDLQRCQDRVARARER